MFPDVVKNLKNPFEGVFPPRTFYMTFAILCVLLIGSVIIFQSFYATPIETPKLTGKIMATVQVVIPKIEEPPLPPPEPEVKAEEPPPPPPPQEEKEVALEIEEAVEGLTETTPFGVLPIIRSTDGLRAFDAYKAPFELKKDTNGVIAIVMSDFGLSESFTQKAIETLPVGTTFVASPYSKNIQSVMTGARARGYEVWLGLPMNGALNGVQQYLGPNAILSGLNRNINMERLNTNLGKATGYAGVAISVQPTFLPDAPEFQAIITGIASRGLGLVQLDTADTLVASAAGKSSLPFVQGSVQIDSGLSKETIQNNLNMLVKKALNSGAAVGVFSPSDFTLGFIQEWQKSLEEQHLQIAPLTYATKIGTTVHTQPAAATAPQE